MILPFLLSLRLWLVILICIFSQVSMWRLWNIITLASLSGMLVPRTRFVILVFKFLNICNFEHKRNQENIVNYIMFL